MMASAPSVTIRDATEADQARVVAMCRAFLRASSYGGAAADDDAHLTGAIAMVMTNGRLFLADVGDRTVGMIAMLTFPHPILGRPIASELAWWVEEDARQLGVGVALLRTAEAWAREVGAAAMQCSAPQSNPMLERVYRQRGYHVLETVFLKEFTR